MFGEVFYKAPCYASFGLQRVSNAFVCEKFIAEIFGADCEDAATNSRAVFASEFDVECRGSFPCVANAKGNRVIDDFVAFEVDDFS